MDIFLLLWGKAQPGRGGRQYLFPEAFFLSTEPEGFAPTVQGFELREEFCEQGMDLLFRFVLPEGIKTLDRG